MVSGSISFIASFTIIVMILMTAAKLETPLRRLIFGLSVSDAIASIAAVFTPFMMPAGPGGTMASGNQGTCEAVAFFFHFGYTASALYSLSLCMYYLKIIRYNTRDRDFAKKIEPWLHGISIGYPLLRAIVNMAVGNFNSSGVVCWIAPKPIECAFDPDVECIRGARFKLYRLIWYNIPTLVSFVGIVYVMFVISWNVINQERRNASFRFQVQQTSDAGINQNSYRSFFRHLRSRIGNLFSSGIRDNTPTAYATHGVAASQNRVREAVTQSLLYIATFITTYLAGTVLIILEWMNVPLPFALLLFHMIFAPLGGFFNILVYTRPKVSTVRRHRPEYWWFQAFWLVVKAGGDMPELPRRSNHTDGSALRSRLAATSSQAVDRSTRDEAMNDSSGHIKSTRHSRASLHDDDDVVEQLELALVRSEEEGFNVDEGPATESQN